MGTIRRIGENYVVEFYARGLKYQQKCGPSRKKARALLKEIEEKIARGEAALIVRDVDTDIFLEDFLAQTKKITSAKTFGRYRQITQEFLSYLKKNLPEIQKLSQLTPRVIEQFRLSLAAHGTQAVNLTLFLLHDVFEYAIKLSYLNDNLLLHIRFLKSDDTSCPQVLTQGEIDNLLKFASLTAGQIVRTILSTGMGARELVDLKWPDVDFGRSIVRIPQSGAGRTKSYREIPLDSQLSEIFEPSGCFSHRRAHPARPGKPERRAGEERSDEGSHGILPRFARQDEGSNSEENSPTPQIFKNPNKVLTNVSGGKSFIFWPDIPGQVERTQMIQKIEEQLDAMARKNKSRHSVFDTLRHTFAFNLINKGISLSRLQLILGHTDIIETMIYSPFIIERQKEKIHKF